MVMIGMNGQIYHIWLVATDGNSRFQSNIKYTQDTYGYDWYQSSFLVATDITTLSNIFGGSQMVTTRITLVDV